MQHPRLRQPVPEARRNGRHQQAQLTSSDEDSEQPEPREFRIAPERVGELMREILAYQQRPREQVSE